MHAIPARLLAVTLWLGGGAAAAADRPAQDPDAGRTAYLESCARCHGEAGRGDGLDAKRFYPRPRDLTVGVYKFRSTVSGTPPTDEDLFRTITEGLPGANMPDWRHLDEQTRWQLVDYLKSLSGVFDDVSPEPVKPPKDPGPERVDLAKGRRMYELLGCAACHGEAGRANGPSAAGLVDDWAMRIRPANLTQGRNYRGGSDPQSITMRFLAGIDGTGMPSYAEAIAALPDLALEDVWHLAYYVSSLQEPALWNMIAHPLRVEGALPAAFDDPRWTLAEQTDARVRNVVTPTGEWAAPATITAVSFEAIHNDEEIALHIWWDDPTQDPPAAASPTQPGQAADRPSDGLAVLLKPPGIQGDVVTLQAWPYEGAPPLDLCYWSADRGRASEVLATDVDRVRRQTPAEALLQSAAAYADGRWHLVLRRPLQPTDPEGAAVIALDGLTSIAFAVWDGGTPGSRAVSPWVDLSIRRRAQ